MEKILININTHLNLIKLLFAGAHLPSNSAEIEELTKDLRDLEIYTYAQDRENLRQDRNNVSKDFHKAFSEKELEITGY